MRIHVTISVSQYKALPPVKARRTAKRNRLARLSWRQYFHWRYLGAMTRFYWTAAAADEGATRTGKYMTRWTVVNHGE